MNTSTPRVYIACLAAYNSGYLHGKWIDANQPVDTLQSEINAILASSPIADAEEWAIHDYEAFGSGILSEYTGLETVSDLASFIVDHGELGEEILSHANGDIADARYWLEECYHGEFNNEEDFAYHWVHEVDCREIPNYLACYIDYKSMAHDFFINDFFNLDVNNKIHVFSHR